MFTFTILEDKEGQAVGFEAQGHVGVFNKGENLGCAAASFLANTLITAIKDELFVFVNVKQGANGELSCLITNMLLPPQQEKVDFLFRIAERGLKDLPKMDASAEIRVERKRK